ncbi:MAG: class I SAM-dependent methyltransferase [Acidobacteria bacterium]|nr:class I SAM-dependent methyltransferase [Acidobacteriota bacterium]
MPSLRHWLARGTPDTARAAIQPGVVEAALEGFRLGGRCLNAGSGEGMFAGVIDRQAGIAQAVNVDIGWPQAPAGGRVRHTAVRGDLQRLPFAPASFDCALCTEVLEHVPDDRLAVSELARVLRAGAILLVTVPSPPAPPDAAHVREGYTLEGMTALLVEGGFAVEKHAWCFHGLMRAALVIWARVPASSSMRRLMPRAFFHALGRADARLAIGRPWDLVVVARRR